MKNQFFKGRNLEQEENAIEPIDGVREAYFYRNYLFPMLARKLAEIYYEKPRELHVYHELLCQRLDLDFSTCLLSFIKSASLPSLNEFDSKNLKNETSRDDLVKLLSSIIYFISPDSTKRTVFVDEN